MIVLPTENKGARTRRNKTRFHLCPKRPRVKSAPTLCPFHHLDTLHCTQAPTCDLGAVPEEQGLRTARGVLSSMFPSQEINDLQKHGLISSPTCLAAEHVTKLCSKPETGNQYPAPCYPNTHQMGKKNTRFLRGNIGQRQVGLCTGFGAGLAPSYSDFKALTWSHRPGPRHDLQCC